TGVGPMVGHNVSHSNIKTKRRFLPALSPATLQSEALGQSFKLRVTNAALRTLDFKGGLDAFLVGARDEQLSPRALKIKRQLKAKLRARRAAGGTEPWEFGKGRPPGRPFSFRQVRFSKPADRAVLAPIEAQEPADRGPIGRFGCLCFQKPADGARFIVFLR